MASMRGYTLAKYSSTCLLILCMCLLTSCSQRQPTGGTGGGISITPTPGEPFRAIRFVDQTHSWALTKDKVMRSLDGGKTWVNVTKSVSGGTMLGTGDNVEGVFQTADRAWILTATSKGGQSGGVTVRVWRTNDGGVNWDSSTFDDNEAISFADRPNFVNAKTGWVLLGTGAGAGSFGVHLYQTKDGGVSWKQIAAAPGKLPLSGQKSGPSFGDEQTGWIANPIGALNNAILLYRSNDGGVNWSKQSLPLVASYKDANYTPTPPIIFGSTIYEPVHVNTGSGNHLVIYGSGNGGKTWYPGKVADFDTQNLYLINNKGVSVAIDKGTVYRLDDKGNWSKVGTVPATAGPMSFINDQEGWVLDLKNPALYHTTNGGTSWETINYSFVLAS